jgi:VanZ like family
MANSHASFECDDVHEPLTQQSRRTELINIDHLRRSLHMSHFRTAFRHLFIVGTIAVMVFSILPGQEMPSLGISDKIEHIVAYALLGLTGGLAFPTPKATILLLVLLPTLGIALEVVQLLSPGRSSDVKDALANGAGATITLLPILIVRFGLSRQRG